MYVMPGVALATGWALVAGAVGLAAGMAFFLGTWGIVEQLPNGQRHHLETNFHDLLRLSIVALGGQSTFSRQSRGFCKSPS